MDRNQNLSSHLASELQLRDYLEICGRRKWWIIFSVTAIFTATLVVALRLPNVYRAETVILVDPQQVPNAYVMPTVSSSISDRLSTIRQQVMSPTRLSRIIDTMGLYRQLEGKTTDQEIVGVMQKATTIDLASPGGQQLSAFRIAFHGRNPVEVAQVANQLAAMFIEENLKAREQQSYGTAEFLDVQLQDTKKQLAQKEDELTRIKSQNIMDLPESKQFHLEALTNLRNQLRASQDRLNRSSQEKVYLQSLMVSSTPTVDLDSGFGGPAVSPLHSQIQKLETQLADLQTRYGPGFPDVRKVRSQLEELKAKLPKEENEPAPATAVRALQRTPRNPVIESQLQKLDQDIQQETKLQAELEPQISFHLSKLEREPVFEQRISGLMRDYDALRGHYSRLLDKKLSAEMASALESRQKGERFVILDPAQIPDRPYSPNRLLIALAGLFGGIVSGIGLAYIQEMADESVRNEREAATIVGKPVLGGIPQVLTVRQRRWDQLRAAGAMVAAVACSAAVGFLIAYLNSGTF